MYDDDKVDLDDYSLSLLTAIWETLNKGGFGPPYSNDWMLRGQIANKIVSKMLANDEYAPYMRSDGV